MQVRRLPTSSIPPAPVPQFAGPCMAGVKARLGQRAAGSNSVSPTRPDLPMVNFLVPAYYGRPSPALVRRMIGSFCLPRPGSDIEPGTGSKISSISRVPFISGLSLSRIIDISAPCTDNERRLSLATARSHGRTLFLESVLELISSKAIVHRLIKQAYMKMVPPTIARLAGCNA